ncbi:MAG: hypothetical protein FIB00_11980 [Chloroflexi bacterium]|nr:hypothetical protein [Dehalococcoidia bacterium]NJD65940.1 hypothetical protein [Chloroflexota bacterium]PWB44986.1 MAG: hypothetical protein C3F10_07185 [Dehalococcoidia bacterium]
MKPERVQELFDTLSPAGRALVLFVAAKAAEFEAQHGPLTEAPEHTADPRAVRAGERIIAMVETAMALTSKKPKPLAASEMARAMYRDAMATKASSELGPLGRALTDALFTDVLEVPPR